MFWIVTYVVILFSLLLWLGYAVIPKHNAGNKAYNEMYALAAKFEEQRHFLKRREQELIECFEKVDYLAAQLNSTEDRIDEKLEELNEREERMFQRIKQVQSSF